MARPPRITLLYGVLCAVSLAYLFLPGADGPVWRGAVLLLFFGEAIESTVRSWKAGHLSKPLSELLKAPPRSDPLQVLAFALGAIAIFRMLHLT